MIISRAILLQGMLTFFASTRSPSPSSATGDQPQIVEQPTEHKVNPKSSFEKAKIYQQHTAPNGINYDQNPTVFGKVLRGELPASILEETNDTLAFEDRAPRAPLHALVIPKRYVQSVFSLQTTDLPLLEEMHQVALDLVQKQYPEAITNGDYILCYHVPPFNSVAHLHLHVLAPASQMKLIYRHGEYQVGTRWCTDEESVRNRLKMNRRPVPYKYASVGDFFSAYKEWF
mmetsp:Transcript_24371/g.34009  ORF Transcript_24371/g.34009 Transcript_24371/m.34009 type:complete len:230 (+) Transcript_24371:35-724(+)